jgi:hypothetical protein
MKALDFITALLTRRLVAIGCTVAVASVVAAFSAASANAAPGDVYFRGDGNGVCRPTVRATLVMQSPGLTVYGMTSTNHVRVWYRIVDDFGRAQSQWGDLGLKSATATMPATYGSNEVIRGQLNQWSRFQYFVAWYAISGSGTFNPVRSSYVTLSSYRVYGIDVYNSTLSFQGFNSACFG